MRVVVEWEGHRNGRFSTPQDTDGLTWQAVTGITNAHGKLRDGRAALDSFFWLGMRTQQRARRKMESKLARMRSHLRKGTSSLRFGLGLSGSAMNHL